NGCSACALGHFQNLKKGGMSDERLASVATWHDTPFYSDALWTEVSAHFRRATDRGNHFADRLAESVQSDQPEGSRTGRSLQLARLIAVCSAARRRRTSVIRWRQARARTGRYRSGTAASLLVTRPRQISVEMCSSRMIFLTVSPDARSAGPPLRSGT